MKLKDDRFEFGLKWKLEECGREIPFEDGNKWLKAGAREKGFNEI